MAQTVSFWEWSVHSFAYLIGGVLIGSGEAARGLAIMVIGEGLSLLLRPYGTNSTRARDSSVNSQPGRFDKRRYTDDP